MMTDLPSTHQQNGRFLCGFCRRNAQKIFSGAFSRVFPGINKRTWKRGRADIRFKKIKGPGGSVWLKGGGGRLGTVWPHMWLCRRGDSEHVFYDAPPPLSSSKRHCRCQFDEWAFGHSSSSGRRNIDPTVTTSRFHIQLSKPNIQKVLHFSASSFWRFISAATDKQPTVAFAKQPF